MHSYKACVWVESPEVIQEAFSLWAYHVGIFFQPRLVQHKDAPQATTTSNNIHSINLQL